MLDLEQRTFQIDRDARVHALPRQVELKLFTAQSDLVDERSARSASTPTAAPTAGASRSPPASASTTWTSTGSPAASRSSTDAPTERDPAGRRSAAPRRRRAGPRAARDGFSLLEVLVAFVILSLVATALFRLFSGALGNASAADDYSRAVLVAESVLAEAAATQPLARGPAMARPTTGASRGRRKVARTRRPTCRPSSSAHRRSMPTRLYRITAEVTFPAPSAAIARSRSRRRASDRGMRNDGGAVARARLHARRAHGRAGADGADGGGDVRLAVARRAELGQRRSQGDPGVRHAPDADVPALAALGAVSAAPLEGGSSCRSSSPASATRSGTPPRCRRASPRAASTFPRCRRETATSRGWCRSAWSPTSRRWSRPSFATPSARCSPRASPRLRIGYFGRDAGAADADAPTWRDRWDDKQRLPLLVRIDVKPEKGQAWPTLVVEPRRAPEAGCVSAMQARVAASRAELMRPDPARKVTSRRTVDARGATLLTARHRADRRALAHGAADGDRERLRVQHARRGARRAQRDVAGAGARRGRRRRRARCVRAAAAARTPDVWTADGQPRTWQDGEVAISRRPSTKARADRPQLAADAPAQRPAAERRRARCGRRAAPARGDRRLARRRRPAPPERRRGRRLPRRGAQVRSRPTRRSRASANCSACSA